MHSSPAAVAVAIRWLEPERTADLALPSYETAGSAGMDVCAAVDGDQLLQPGQRALVPTGLAVAVPGGYELQVRPRSGLAIRHGITLINSPGTIDADYRGEVKIALINLGHEVFRIQRGDRIAQLVLAPVATARLMLRDRLDETERGDGGFGHTGVR
ncbi:dUTP diphosphatase [Desulfofustis limnaeus]|uniref:Deoxyuridine 5'-triphosphate nucleotidohydrolase n=1 Tax=Desulfofustis limnaeus TaxID=2740163 RepID=A0ABM7W9Z0_9BACT|nr:dUTP diphosphatase [Desulfofustis limnaeus]MDX9894437.1 dUTP diphosphatase [Desulfofustis sp.]BDD87784.1 deoxyuridine 5'-triphosphate nucleotidohydrolase [Desulfofustis limnaeus]